MTSGVSYLISYLILIQGVSYLAILVRRETPFAPYSFSFSKSVIQTLQRRITCDHLGTLGKAALKY